MKKIKYTYYKMVILNYDYLWECCNSFLRDLLFRLNKSKSGVKAELVTRIEIMLQGLFPIEVEDADTSEEIHSKIMLSLQNPRRLGGIKHLAYFKNIYSKDTPYARRILLLGERHRPYQCENSVPVSDWIFRLASTSLVCLDIFVETHPHSVYKLDGISWEPLPGKQSQLDRLQVGLDSCDVYAPFSFHRRKEECAYPNVRYHKIDLRFLNDYNFYEEMDEGRKYVVNNGRTLDAEKIIKDKFKLIIGYFAGFTLPEFKSSFDYSGDGERGAQEIFRIYFGDTYEQKWHRYLEYRNVYLEFIQKQVQKIPNFSKFLVGCYFRALKWSTPKEIFDSFSISLQIVKQDVYFILRYLHHYDLEKLDRGPPVCTSTHQYSIIYAGSQHTRFYEYFFEDYYNTDPDVSQINYYEQCITLESPINFFDP